MKILFPTDFSAAAENAYVYALKLADRLKADMTVLHVYEVLEFHSWIEDAMDTDQLNEKITLGEFERFREQIDLLKRIAGESQLEHVRVNYVLKESDQVVDAIHDQARTDLADLIVMGTKGATGLREIFFGSVATRVMETSVCPVFVVPDIANFRGIHKVGLALEFKDSELRLIQRALALTRRLGAHLHCIHVDVYDPDKVRAKVKEYREAFEEEADISFHTYYDLDIEKGLHEFMKYNLIDALIMQIHPKTLLQELFSYSIAKRIAYHADTPLIAMAAPVT